VLSLKKKEQQTILNKTNILYFPYLNNRN